MSLCDDKNLAEQVYVSDIPKPLAFRFRWSQKGKYPASLGSIIIYNKKE